MEALDRRAKESLRSGGVMALSRRQFSKRAGAFAALVASSRPGFGFAASGLRLGLNTWSLRALSGDAAIPTILQMMKETNLQDCQLLFSHVEPERFNPVFPVAGESAHPAQPSLEQQKAIADALREWRLSVPMSYFEDIRASFEREGLRIQAYAARLGTTPDEIDRQFLMTKALGAETINLRIPEPLTAIVAAVADRHRMTVGLQFSNLNAMEVQRKASKYFRLDPDIGDLTKVGVDALKFVEDRYESFSSLDLKDAVAGGGSVPFGTGQSQMKDVLQLLREKQARMTAYIDCDYPGTGRSTEEVKRCIAYARRYLA